MARPPRDIKVKGSVLKARLGFVQELAGPEGVKRVKDRLLPEDRAVLERLLPTGWYPFDTGRRLDDAIVQELGGGRGDFFVRLGEASAERNLTGVHRAFLRPGDPHAFLAQAPEIYAFYYDRGRRTYQATGPTEGVLTTHDAETFSMPDCMTVVGWHIKALRMCGAADVSVVEEECRARGGSVCRYRVRWS